MILPRRTVVRTLGWAAFGYPDGMSAGLNVQVIFIGSDGATHRVTAVPGQTVMQAALSAGVPGIGGICGGDKCCATCVVRPAQDWVSRLSHPVEDEQIVVQGLPAYHPDDRLGCQIRLDGRLDGLVVTLP